MDKKITYDNKTLTKINACKSSRTDYRVVVQGEAVPKDNNYRRMTIVVTKEGRFIRTYYG
jgi:hypothetical protein